MRTRATDAPQGFPSWLVRVLPTELQPQCGLVDCEIPTLDTPPSTQGRVRKYLLHLCS